MRTSFEIVRRGGEAFGRILEHANDAVTDLAQQAAHMAFRVAMVYVEVASALAGLRGAADGTASALFSEQGIVALHREAVLRQLPAARGFGIALREIARVGAMTVAILLAPLCSAGTELFGVFVIALFLAVGMRFSPRRCASANPGAADGVMGFRATFGGAEDLIAPSKYEFLAAATAKTH